MKMMFAFLFFPLMACASGDFSMTLTRGKESEWFRAVPKGKEWECATHLSPMSETPGNPLKTLNWVSLEQEEQTRPKKCETSVKINDTRDGKNKLVTTCLSQPATKALYDTLRGNCGSSM